MFSQYLGLHKEVYFFVLGRFVAAVGTFVSPLIVIILAETLGYSSIEIGIALSVLGGAILFGNIIGGRIIDNVGWQYTLIVSMGLYAFLYLIAGATIGNHIALIAILIAYFFVGIISVTFTFIASEISTKSTRNVIFSLSYMSFNFGFAIGTAMASFVYYYSIQLLFYLDAIFTILSLIIIIKYIYPNNVSNVRKKVKKDLNEVTDSFLSYLKTDIVTLIFLAVFALISFAHHHLLIVFPQQLSFDYINDGAKIFALLMSFSALLVLISSPILIALTRNIPIFKSIAIGNLLYLSSVITMFFANSIYHYIVAIIFWIAGEVLVMTYGEIYLQNSSPFHYRGRAAALFHMVYQVSSIFSPIIVGLSIHSSSIHSSWCVSYFAITLAAVALGSIYHR